MKYKKIKSRADYGTYLIKYLSERLTKEFGRGFSVQNLKNIRQFYETFSIGSTVWSQSGGSDVKLNTCPKLLLKLNWSHVKIIMRVDNNVRRTNDLNIKSNSNLNNNKDIGSKGIKKDMGFEMEM